MHYWTKNVPFFTMLHCALILVISACAVDRPVCVPSGHMNIITANGPLRVAGLAPSSSPPEIEVTSTRLSDGVSDDGVMQMVLSSTSGTYELPAFCDQHQPEETCGSVWAPYGPKCGKSPEDMTIAFEMVPPADWPETTAATFVPIAFDYTDPGGSNDGREVCLWNDWCVWVYPPCCGHP